MGAQADGFAAPPQCVPETAPVAESGTLFIYLVNEALSGRFRDDVPTITLYSPETVCHPFFFSSKIER